MLPGSSAESSPAGHWRSLWPCQTKPTATLSRPRAHLSVGFQAYWQGTFSLPGHDPAGPFLPADETGPSFPSRAAQYQVGCLKYVFAPSCKLIPALGEAPGLVSAVPTLPPEIEGGRKTGRAGQRRVQAVHRACRGRRTCRPLAKGKEPNGFLKAPWLILGALAGSNRCTRP